MLVESNAASSFLPITSLQAEHYQATTHSFSQRESAIPSDFSGFRTLSIVTGGGVSLEGKRACSQSSVRKAPAQVTFLRGFTRKSGRYSNQLRCCAHQARHASGCAEIVAPVMS